MNSHRSSTSPGWRSSSITDWRWPAHEPTRIKELIVTPIAFRDPPLLNSNGVHEPLALRVILQLVLEDGTVGLGESPGGVARLERLQAAAKVVVGMDVFDATAVSAAIDAALLPTVPSSHERGWTTSVVEVACLDAQGKLLGRPVSDLLGGKVRDAVPFAAYLFYKWAEHPALDGRPAVGDDWGEARRSRRSGRWRRPSPDSRCAWTPTRPGR